MLRYGTFAMPCKFLIGAFCVSLITTAARAQDSANTNGVRLSFVRAENAGDCMAAPALQREIVRRMGHDVFAGPAQQWIEGFIQRQADYFELQLFERDAEGKTIGSRRLREQADDCHKLDDAIVLALALIIDPTAQLAAASSAPDTTVPQSTGTSVAGTPVRTTLSPPQRSSHAFVPALPRRDAPVLLAPPTWRESVASTQQEVVRKPGAAFATADAVVLAGALPGSAFGAELTTRMAIDPRERVALRFSGLFVPEKRQSTRAGDLGFSLTALEAGACLSSSPRRAGRFIGFGCVGFGLGAVHTVVHSPEPFKPDDRLWAAFRFEIGAHLRVVGPVWLGVRVFDLLAPRRWDFNVMVNQQRTLAFSQKALMPGAALGVGLHFD
jgi:hypothetical protein